MSKEIHKYFCRKSSDWRIIDFLNENDIEPFEKKIDVYIKSLNNIIALEKGKRRERALTLLEKYKEASREPFLG